MAAAAASKELVVVPAGGRAVTIIEEVQELPPPLPASNGALVVPPPPGALLSAAARAATQVATSGVAPPAGGITVVQNNTYVAGSVDASRTTTTTTTTTTTNNEGGDGGNHDGHDHNYDDEEDERPGVPLPGKPQGSRLGKCFYAKCKSKEIVRDYGATGYNCSYFCCRHSCGGEVIHATCARSLSFELDKMGTLIERPCAKCHRTLVIRTEVAFVQAIFFWLLDWPWWFLTRIVPALITAGMLYKLMWFVLVVFALWPTDTFSNPQLVRQDAISGDLIHVRPRLTLSGFASYNFCKPSQLDWFCPMFKTGCNGMAYCSYGGFTMVKLYRLRLLGYRFPWPVPWFEHGHLWCAAYFFIYIVSWIYWLFYRWKLHLWFYRRFTKGFQRTTVQSRRADALSSQQRRRGGSHKR